MNNLQKLLDERWPINKDTSDNDILYLVQSRSAFTEGYNAALSDTELDMDEVEESAKKYALEQGERYYTGCKQGYMSGAQDWCAKTIIHFKNIDNIQS